MNMQNRGPLFFPFNRDSTPIPQRNSGELEKPQATPLPPVEGISASWSRGSILQRPPIDAEATLPEARVVEDLRGAISATVEESTVTVDSLLMEIPAQPKATLSQERKASALKFPPLTDAKGHRTTHSDVLYGDLKNRPIKDDFDARLNAANANDIHYYLKARDKGIPAMGFDGEVNWLRNPFQAYKAKQLMKTDKTFSACVNELKTRNDDVLKVVGLKKPGLPERKPFWKKLLG